MTIYFLHGDDLYRLSKQKEKIIDKYKNSADFSIKKIFSSDEFETQAFSQSFFAQNKLLIIDLSELELNSLLKSLEYFSKQKNNLISILFFYRGNPDKRTKIIKLIENISDEIIITSSFKPWNREEIVDWLKTRAHEENIKINKLALEKLVEIFSNDTGSLNNELIRLSNYSCTPENTDININIKNNIKQREIQVADVEKICTGNQEIFSLADSILDKNFSFASFQIKNICSFLHYLPVISALQKIFRNYLIILSMDESKKSQSDIASFLGQHPFRIKQDLKKLKNISSVYLFKIIQALNDTEESAKTGSSENIINYLRHKIMSLELKI